MQQAASFSSAIFKAESTGMDTSSQILWLCPKQDPTDLQTSANMASQPFSQITGAVSFAGPPGLHPRTKRLTTPLYRDHPWNFQQMQVGLRSLGLKESICRACQLCMNRKNVIKLQVNQGNLSVEWWRVVRGGKLCMVLSVEWWGGCLIWTHVKGGK